MRPHDITREFEKSLCQYTGAPYAVAVNSCTMAILLAVAYCLKEKSEKVVSIPARTYVSVPQSIKHAGGTVVFDGREWQGCYEIRPINVWDCARRFTKGMYIHGQYQCLSFHSSKILGDSQGGAILHSDQVADSWFRRARFDGRSEGALPDKDFFSMIGWHCYMSPDVSSRLLWKMESIADHNEDLPNDAYPDLSKFQVFNDEC